MIFYSVISSRFSVSHFHRDMVSAADILSVMRQAGLQPSADTYKELICGYAKHGDIESVTRTITECQTNNIHLLDTDYLSVINALAINGHSEHVDSVRTCSKTVKLDIVCV